MIGRKVPTADTLNQFQSTLGTKDVIWQPLYDMQTYGTQGNTQFTFFNTPIGQGTTSAPGATGSKTLADTNMVGAGILNKGNRFLCVGVEMLLFPGAASSFGPGESTTEGNVGRFANDVYAVGKAGVVTFTVGSDRIYVQDGPLNQFPPCTRLTLAAALAIAATSTALNQVDYAAWGGEPYTIVPLYIDETQGFSFTLSFPAAVSPPSAIAPRIGARLRGYRIRNAQ